MLTLITAIAGLVTAVTGLVTAIHGKRQTAGLRQALSDHMKGRRTVRSDDL